MNKCSWAVEEEKRRVERGREGFGGLDDGHLCQGASDDDAARRENEGEDVSV